MRTKMRWLFIVVAVTSSVVCRAADSQAGALAAANSSLYLKVQLDHPLKLSKLKQGDVVQGKLVRDVYSSSRKLLPAGLQVRLLVDRMEKRRRIPDDHWPGVVKLFTPRHENFPVFKTATVSGASGETTLQVSLISIGRRREVHAQAKRRGSGSQGGNVEVSESNAAQGSQKAAPPTMILEAVGKENQESPSASGDGTDSPISDLSNTDLSSTETLPAGTSCKIALLTNVSASGNKPGDMVQARLIEPVLSNSRVVLPAGTLFEGNVARKLSPRWGSRAGSLALSFTGMTPPSGNVTPIAASLAGAELDRRSHTKIDAEGQLHGERPGKAWMAINMGVTAGLAKEADDTLQLIIEAVVSTATDVSTAGVGRIVAAGVSGIYMVSRKGRDVVLPRFTEMDITLDRPLSVPGKRNPR
jgi:hypothetical protein